MRSFALSSNTLVKFLLYRFAIAACALPLCACVSPASVTAPSALPVTSAALRVDDVDPVFLRAFVQNGFEAPHRLEPVRVLRGPLRVYLRTQDDAGHPVDGVTLDTTEQVLIDSARTWSGDTGGVTAVVRGTGTREKVSGWITIKWTTAMSRRCGRSTVGVDGGFIELNISGACDCGLATKIYPRLVRHELGHAMGYYHTDHESDVMYGQPVPAAACDARPSERERRHARFVHRVQP